MIIPFTKYQGTGNDFIMIDNLDTKIGLSTSQIIRICDRKFGIGSDGIILIERAEEADFKMVFFNPDASESFCGNGSRCAVDFARGFLTLDSTVYFSASDGLHEAEGSSQEVSVKMSDVTEIKNFGKDYFLNTGSPHYVIFSDDLNLLDIVASAQEARFHERFLPGGTNVNFVQLSHDGIRVRTYERGVEDETLSCGTGVTACALAAAFKLNLVSPISVSTPGGQLKVSFQTKKLGFENIWLSGPATKVYTGTIEI